MPCPNSDLLSQLAALKDYALSNVCGLSGASPLFRTVILRFYSYETDGYSYEEVLPIPFVEENPQGEASNAGVDNVTGDNIRFKVHLSRQYDRSIIQAQTTDFIIDGNLAELEAGDRFSGEVCELDTIKDMVTYWELSLIEKQAEQGFSL